VGSIIVDDEMQVEIGQSPLAEPVLGARRANAPLPMWRSPTGFSGMQLGLQQHGEGAASLVDGTLIEAWASHKSFRLLISFSANAASRSVL
jgi:hypothetical protein